MTDPLGDPTGVYTLRTINGQALPFLYSQIGADKVEFLDGTVTLNADRTFIDATTFRVTEQGVVTTEVDVADGTWSLSGATVRFLLADGSSYSMIWNSTDALTQVFDTFTLVYRK
ncbi:MAG: hypothetical protein AABZ01_13845 [Gemmatimonadota bacterium]